MPVRVGVRTIGEEWVSGARRGPLSTAKATARLIPRVLQEGRGREVLADLAREVRCRGLRLTEEVQTPAYALTPHGLEQRAATPLALTPTTGRLRGWCLAPDLGSVVGWNSHSVLDVQVNQDGGDLSLVTTEIARFERPISVVHRLASGEILVCLAGSLSLLTRESKVVRVLELSTPTSFVRPACLAEDPYGRLIVGEYGNVRDGHGRWVSVAWIYWSEDQAKSWQRSDMLIRAGVNKHVHAVAICPEAKQLFVTTGDNLKWLWSAPLVGPDENISTSISGLRPASTRLMALGGFSGFAITPSTVYWGTDYWMGTNFISAVTHLDPRQDRRWKLEGRLRRNPIGGMTSLAGTNGNYVLAASVNQFRKDQAYTALLAFDEVADTWSCLVILHGAHRQRQQFHVCQCPCSQGLPIALVSTGQSLLAVHERTLLNSGWKGFGVRPSPIGRKEERSRRVEGTSLAPGRTST